MAGGLQHCKKQHTSPSKNYRSIIELHSNHTLFEAPPTPLTIIG